MMYHIMNLFFHMPKGLIAIDEGGNQFKLLVNDHECIFRTSNENHSPHESHFMLQRHCVDPAEINFINNVVIVKMVRSGEYSPNYPGNSNVYNGIAGLGGYEEKRKLYNEQRKLEYKEYVSHLAQKKSSNRKERIQEAVAPQKLNGNDTYSKTKPAFWQRDVSTQTERSELRDASTSTNVRHDMKYEAPGCVADFENVNAVYGKEKPYEREILSIPMPRKEPTPRSCRKQANGDLWKGVTYLNGEEGITFGGRDRKLCKESTASYEQCLRAQIEERQRIKDEQKDMERKEDEGRITWLSGEANKELEKQRVVLERTRALEDFRKQRTEEFLYRTEELQREAEDRRKIKMRSMATQNAVSGKESGFKNTMNSQTEVSKLFQSKPAAKNASDFHKLPSSRHSIKDSSLNCVVPKHMSVSSDEYQGLPNHSARINEESLNLTSEKSRGSPSVLTQLGEIRRQLVTEQLKMEEAVQKTSFHD